MANIQWFPGHMAKAKREMEEKIKLVDMVIEIRDSRIAFSSKNPLLDEIIGNKKRLIVLSKADKAQSEITNSWIDYFTSCGHQAIALNLLNNKNIAKTISAKCIEINKDRIERLKAKGLHNVETKVMVVGIPNVGKSTLINSISNKRVTQTADHPGVTKNLSWIKASSQVALLDTPGVLWNKFDDSRTGYLLAITGAINDDVLPKEEVVNFALEYLLENHYQKLKTRYNITSTTVAETIEQIGNNMGCVGENGLDYQRIYTMILRDIRDNNLGAISWEKVDENI